MPPSQQAQQRRIARQRELNHNIPDVVIEGIRSLKRVRYRQTLSDFASAYFNREFPELSEEFALVREFEVRLLQGCLGTSLSTEIDRIIRAELASNLILEKYRDHFIHAFQDFLIGTIIIDRFYDKFCAWYSTALNANISTCLESAWLLTTLFHDRYKPLIIIAKYLDEEERFRFGNEDENSKGALNMASIYKHLAEGRPLENWALPTTSTTPIHPLQGIILKHVKTRNHAILGALSLLDQNLQQTPIGAPAVFNAALAIAFHNREPREDLLAEHVFPIPMERFPLACLLLYVDAVQEWNRSRNQRDELTDIIFGPDRVTFIMTFSSARANAAKAEEFAGVDKCFQNTPIKLGFAGTIFVGASG